MVLILTPETALMLADDIDRAKAWIKRQGFMGMTGWVFWVVMAIKGIIWLFHHVRFV